jgi:hypothetical protein
VTTPLVMPPNITVNGNGSVLKTPADSTSLGSNDAIIRYDNPSVRISGNTYANIADRTNSGYA